MTHTPWQVKLAQLKADMIIRGLRLQPFLPRGLLGDRCKCCGNRVIAATGPLIQGRYCGACYGAITAEDLTAQSATTSPGAAA